MISGPRPDAPGTAHFYVDDAWNRLAKVFADTDENGQFDVEEDELLAEYRYDGRNRRVEKVLAEASGTPGSVEQYHNHAWQVLEERLFDAQQQPERVYQNIWSPRYIDAPILRDRYDDEGQRDESARVYYLGDANYNVTALVGLVETGPGVSTWQPVERYVYNPYGRVTVCDAGWTLRPDGPDANATPGDESAYGNARLYCGYYLDSETGLYHVRHRFYHPTLSTWTSRDPIGYFVPVVADEREHSCWLDTVNSAIVNDVNLYRYCGSNPLIYTDLLGLAPPKNFP